MHASSLQRVAGCRQGTDEGLALTGGHLHDAALQQSDESAQLCVIGAFVQHPLTGFARQSAVADKCLLLCARAEDLAGGLREFGIAELGEFAPGRVQIVDGALEPTCRLLRMRAGSVEQARKESHCRPSSFVRRCRV